MNGIQAFRAPMIAALVMLAGFPGVCAQGSIHWEADWEAALKKAKDDGRPIMVAFILKGESANDEVVKQHFTNADIVAESKNYVCLPACIHSHAEKDTSPCPDFPGITCLDHIRIVRRAMDELIDSPTISCPQFFFLKADGKTVLLRHVWMLPAADLLRKMRMARGFSDPAVEAPEDAIARDEVTRLLVDAACDHAVKRQAAIQLLASKDDPRIVDFFIKQTAPTADKVKCLEAISAMGRKGNGKALACLHKIILKDDSQTRKAAADSLGEIAMEESGPILATLLKKESKDRVRTHLARALFACSRDAKLLTATIVNLLKSNSQLDQVVALYVAKGAERSPELDKSVLRAASSNNSQIRTAAFYAIGSLKLEAAADVLKKHASSEKDDALLLCHWALDALGIVKFTLDQDPSYIVRNLLMDW